MQGISAKFADGMAWMVQEYKYLLQYAQSHHQEIRKQVPVPPQLKIKKK